MKPHPIVEVVVLVAAITGAQAQGTPATGNYNFLVASGFLCDPNDSTTCQAVAKAANGETIEITGAGTLSAANKSVAAAGAFTEKTAGGEVISTGIWTSAGLISFESYGFAPGALSRDYPQLRSIGRFGIRGPMSGPVVAGGRAVIRIRLLPDAARPEDAILQVTCAKGKLPEEQPNDGVRLKTSGGLSFEEEVSGHTVFLLQRPGPMLPVKRPANASGE